MQWNWRQDCCGLRFWVPVERLFDQVKFDQVIPQEDPVLSNASARASARAMAANSQVTPLHQLSEHSMGMIQGQSPLLKDNCQLEEFGERKVTLHLMVLLCNHQTLNVGVNQS